VDTCCGGTEHAGIDFLSVEQRFDANMRKVLKEAGGRVDFRKLKGSTKSVLPRLIDEGQAFDLVYVDGSHEPHNVLFDLVLAFELTVPGGVLIADDYKWAPNVPGQEDLFQMPKMAIDSFINCNFRWLELIEYPINQIYIRKR
jgi:predicted O-methyltransferase YrrM